jgi:integrase
MQTTARMGTEMLDLVTAQSDLATRAVETALSGLAPNSRRVYAARIREYLAWSHNAGLDRESVKAWMRSLELAGATAQVRNQGLAALKRLAAECGETGWMELGTAQRIGTLRQKRAQGVRIGRWLNIEQAAQLLAAPDCTTIHGRRDAAVLALLLGCGLRRAEACALEVEQIRTNPDGSTILANLMGKGNKIRSVSVPGWAARLIEEWRKEIAQGAMLLRSITAAGIPNGSLSPAAVRDIVRRYGAAIGVPELNPHDLRRTFSQLSRAGGCPIEVIQKSLGHASMQTTERYLDDGRDANAGSYIDLEAHK